MILAEEKKKTNIAEYVLYMWQVEDIIRAYKFDIKAMDDNLVKQFKQPADIQKKISAWYKNLITMMKTEGIEEKGHFGFVHKLILELSDLHVDLLRKKRDVKYRKLYNAAFPNINDYKKKADGKVENEIEVCFTALYGLLMLRLQKKDISKDTSDAITTFSNLLAYIAKTYKEIN